MPSNDFGHTGTKIVAALDRMPTFRDLNVFVSLK
jgi:hypothetical protein